jgi:hypothetical protein
MNSPPQMPNTSFYDNRGLSIKAPSLPLDSVAVTNPNANAILTSKRRVPRAGWYAVSGMTQTSAAAVNATNMRLMGNADGGGGGIYLGTLATRTNSIPFQTIVHVDAPGTIDVVCGLQTDTGVTYYVDSMVITELGPGEGH